MGFHFVLSAVRGHLSATRTSIFIGKRKVAYVLAVALMALVRFCLPSAD